MRHAGTIYRLTQHGFARDLTFHWVARTSDACRLSLVDNGETRAMYPFAFRLDLTYALAGGALAMTFDVFNSGREHLPASFGAHPAFNWPLHSGASQEAYTLTFAQDEPVGADKEFPRSCGSISGSRTSTPEAGFSMNCVQTSFER